MEVWEGCGVDDGAQPEWYTENHQHVVHFTNKHMIRRINTLSIPPPPPAHLPRAMVCDLPTPPHFMHCNAPRSKLCLIQMHVCSCSTLSNREDVVMLQGWWMCTLCDIASSCVLLQLRVYLQLYEAVGACTSPDCIIYLLLNI